MVNELISYQIATHNECLACSILNVCLAIVTFQMIPNIESYVLMYLMSQILLLVFQIEGDEQRTNVTLEMLRSSRMMPSIFTRRAGARARMGRD